ncbi:Uu.00g072310.m01.CDS01 [Anthostomella pinea]|uniref:Uu.00g072310.m01.CDS01 n=1 Tax=Anthostomella pinea TaxID=933095 RepID=A0AAI8VPE8_9PEZI|nr:Uu.00g072310.m01.CDS01 [Anthostomella pinea]
MQFIKIAGLLAALMPLSAMAGPLSAEDTVFKRGIDICSRKADQGDSCNVGAGGNAPHICGRVNPRSILHCVNGKWALDRHCDAGTHCACTSENDITCSS